MSYTYCGCSVKHIQFQLTAPFLFQTVMDCPPRPHPSQRGMPNVVCCRPGDIIGRPFTFIHLTTPRVVKFTSKWTRDLFPLSQGYLWGCLAPGCVSRGSQSNRSRSPSRLCFPDKICLLINVSSGHVNLILWRERWDNEFIYRNVLSRNITLILWPGNTTRIEMHLNIYWCDHKSHKNDFTMILVWIRYSYNLATLLIWR